MINIPGLAEVILNIIIRYNDILDFIVSNQSPVFMLKFW